MRKLLLLLSILISYNCLCSEIGPFKDEYKGINIIYADATLPKIKNTFSFRRLAMTTTIIVANPGTGNDIRPNLETAIGLVNNTNNNVDIIELPSGSFTYTSKTNTNKRFKLRGTGIGATTIYRSDASADSNYPPSGNWEYILRFNPLTDKPCGIEVSGITFKSKTPSLNDGSDGLSVAIDYALIMHNCVDFKIYDCRFENFGNAAIEVNHRDDLARGIIYRCQFEHNAKRSTGSGYGYGVAIYGENKKWIANPGFGSENFIFIEDCNFKTHRHSISAGGCAKYVARYDTFDVQTIGGQYEAQCIDAHDGSGPGNGVNTYGTRAIEVYNCYIVMTKRMNGNPITGSIGESEVSEKLICIRGGDAVIHHNTLYGGQYGVLIEPNPGGLATSYPFRSQPGFLSGYRYKSSHTGTDARKGDGDVFIWSNTWTPMTFTPSAESLLSKVPDSQSSYCQVNRDYHLVAKPKYVQYPYPHRKYR